jgi:hypothetical protein
MIIGYDPNPYYNFDNLVQIDQLDISKNEKGYSSPTHSQKKHTNSEKDNFYYHIPINEVFENLIFETYVKVSRPIVDVFPIEYVKSSVFFNLKEGVKRKTYINLIHGLCFLNPNVNPSYVFNYLVYINKRYGIPPMDFNKLKELFSFVYNSIKNNPDYICTSVKIRNIHFRKKNPITTDEKKYITNKLNSIITKNSSIRKINETKELLLDKGIKITQKNIQEFSGLSLSTIKRYYRVEEIEDLQWWIDYFNSEEYLNSLGYEPKSTFGEVVELFENEIYFHPTCPQYVINYFQRKKSA